MKKLLAVLLAVMIMVPSMVVFAETGSAEIIDIKQSTATIKNFEYNGSLTKPKSTIVYNGQTLVEGVDFKFVSGLTHKNVGTYDVVIQGIGKFQGTMTVSYQIKKVANTVALSQTKTATYSKTSNMTVSTKQGNGTASKWYFSPKLKNQANAKYVKVDLKTGKVTILKGAPKGACFNIKIRYEGDANHYARETSVKIKVQ